MPVNYAAVLPGKGESLVVQEAPFPTPGAHQLVVRGHAVAANPIDYMIQAMGHTLFPWLKFPAVLGSDVSGELVIGDRVVASAIGLASGDSAQRAFQHYVLVEENLACPIPDWMAYENASVLPLGLNTSMAGLFLPEYLSLQYPSFPAKKSTGETVLIWGGSTSVGSSAIQMTVAAGYEVVTTCSPRNFDYVRRLGAIAAFDYNSSTVQSDLVQFFKGKSCGGALAIAGVDVSERNSVATACLNIVAQAEGRKFAALTMPLPDEMPAGVDAKFIFASHVKGTEACKAVYRDYLPLALAEKSFIPSPEPEVVGSGLASLQAALERLKRGVSAKKIVVSLP